MKALSLGEPWASWPVLGAQGLFDVEGSADLWRSRGVAA